MPARSDPKTTYQPRFKNDRCAPSFRTLRLPSHFPGYRRSVSFEATWTSGWETEGRLAGSERAIADIYLNDTGDS